MALGGYGRKEMYFYSDIDLLLLVPERAAKTTQQAAEALLTLLWDAGLKLGHQVASVSQVLEGAAKDFTQRTALLEARYVAGPRPAATRLKRRFKKEIVEGSSAAFVEAKLAEWKARHTRTGDSRYVLEPNIKENKGGLRDVQTLMWLVHYCYGVTRMRDLAKMGKITPQELREFRRARKFLQLVRLHLHAFAGRAEERLGFDAQRHIAVKLGYKQHGGTLAVERFMKRYFMTASTVGQMTRTLCYVLDEEQKRAPRRSLIAFFRKRSLPEGFEKINDRLHFANPLVPAKNPAQDVGAFLADA